MAQQAADKAESEVELITITTKEEAQKLNDAASSSRYSFLLPLFLLTNNLVSVNLMETCTATYEISFLLNIGQTEVWYCVNDDY